MKGIFKEILDATQGPHANGVLYAGAVGLLLSNIIPTPADALYFHREKKLKEKWDNKEITPEKYWQKTATAYYVYKPVWWGLVISAMYFTKGDVKDKAKIGLMIVGAGAVVGIDTIQAVMLAGLLGVATVIERLARAFLDDGKLSLAEINDAFKSVDKKAN